MKVAAKLVSVFVIAIGFPFTAVHGNVQNAVDAYRLGAGDELRITVFNQQDLSGTFVIGGDGTISMPLIGQVKAGGEGLRELEAAIENAFKPDYLRNPSVSIEVLNYRPFYILGEVNDPGSYPYVAGMRVANAVALAGGYTERARKGRVSIERDGFPDSQIRGDGGTSVLPGDIVRVPERFF